MRLKVLIVEPHAVTRIGLCEVFNEDTRVSNVYEATTKKELYIQIHNNKPDLMVINQSLIADTAHLWVKNVVVLADDPDITLLKAAYKNGARGYLSLNVSAELLRTMLRPDKNAFLIEPTLVPQIMERMFADTHFMVMEGALTPREKEIVYLLSEGLDRSTIARQLCIADTTLKTHLKNISKKKDFQLGAVR